MVIIGAKSSKMGLLLLTEARSIAACALVKTLAPSLGWNDSQRAETLRSPMSNSQPDESSAVVGS